MAHLSLYNYCKWAKFAPRWLIRLLYLAADAEYLPTVVRSDKAHIIGLQVNIMLVVLAIAVVAVVNLDKDSDNNDSVLSLDSFFKTVVQVFIPVHKLQLHKTNTQPNVVYVQYS